ncbi:21392_t:CDS:1, partial [Cetraspora pellucida]
MNNKTFVFNEYKKEGKTVLGLLEFFGINRSVDVTLNYFDDIDTISQRVIDEYNLDIKLSDLRLNASLMPDCHNSSGIQAYYYFAFIFDDLMIFKGIDYIDLINGLENRKNNLPPLVSEMLSTFMNHWKKDFKDKYTLLRTEAITWATS